MATNEFGFTPAAGGVQAPASGGAPAQATPAAANQFGFTPAGTATTPQPAQGGGIGNDLMNFGGSLLNLINNNPVSKSLTSLAALPVQLGVKGINAAAGTNYPDPYAGGIGSGPGAAKVTSSDQPLGQFAEQEAGNAITAGSLFAPVGAAADAVTPFLSGLGRFAGPTARVGVQTALGALQGLGGGMQEGQSGAQLKSSAQTGALIGGGLATAGEFGSALLSSIGNTTPEDRLLSQKDRLKTLQNSFDDNSTFTKNAATGKFVETSNPIQTLSTNGLVSKLKVVDGRVNTEGVESGLQDLLDASNKRATTLVQGLTGTVPATEFQTTVEDAIKNNPTIRGSGGVSKALGQVQRMFEDYTNTYGADLTYPQINEIRTSMNRYFNADTVDVERAVGNAARDTLYSAEGGSPELKGVMGNIGQYLKAQDFVDRLRGTVVRGGRLGKYLADMVGSGVGTAMGSALGPFGMGVGAVAGGAAADKAMSMYQNNFFNPMMARGANALSRFAASPAAGSTAQIGKAVLIPSAVQK